MAAGVEKGTLPPRLLREELPSGPAKGKVAELQVMLADYYEARGGRRKATPLTPNSRSFACKGLHERQVFRYVSYDCGAGVH